MFHENTRITMIPGFGTDTPGPGESVSAIRFIGKLIFSTKNGKMKFQNFEKNPRKDFRKFPRNFPRIFFLLFLASECRTWRF